MSIWFTSDTHFWHANVIAYCKRPYQTVSEMDERLTENWNQAIRPDDTVYHLGDFTLAGQGQAKVYFARLNGRIFVVPGGHDKHWISKGEYLSKSGHPVMILPPLQTIKVSIPDLDKPQVLVLCHYAMRVWDRSHYGSWHLYGHSHGNLPPFPNSLDVGVDNWEYVPISLGRVVNEIGEKDK